MSAIPVLDWHQYQASGNAVGFRAMLGSAFRQTGFALLSNHGVRQSLIDQTFHQADRFFELPISEKAALDIKNNPNNRGWVLQGSERLDETSDQIDAKEAFNIGLDLSADDPRINDVFRGVNIWPKLDGFRETMIEYYNALWQLGVDMHRPIAEDLGLNPGYFEEYFTAPMATLRLLRYPQATGVKDAIGAGAHTDYGSITLLMTDGEPGLQVKPIGCDWIDVPHLKGAFIINIGDCLMRWTNDLYVSTPHRVLAPKRQRRSIAFFLDPNPDAVIKALPGIGCTKYPPVTGADYLRSRLDATYQK